MPAQKKPEKVEENTPKSESQTAPPADTPKIVPEKVLFTWVAKARPFKRRDRDFWVTLIAIAAVVGLILFFMEGYMPVLLIIALVFLSYILSTVEPENIEYKVTNRGIKIVDSETSWSLLTRFWFSRRFDYNLLVFEAQNLTGRLELVINEQDKDKLRKVLKTYVTEEEIPPSGIDKAANWFSGKLPGNR